MSDQLKRYYKGKAKKPELYGYDDEGNLVEYNKEGEVTKTIALPRYRPPTFEEFDEMEKDRMEAIATANKEYEDARKELREMYMRPDALDSEILRINRKVVEADTKLQVLRFPLRFVEEEKGLEIRRIDFSQPNEVRKFPYSFGILKTNPYTLEQQYVRVGEVAKKPLVSVAEVKAAAALGVPVILFSEPETNDYGFLSLKWAVELELNGTMYNSAHQAIAAELAKSFNDQASLNRIMLAETPDAIDYTLEDVPGDKDVNETKWINLTKQLLYDVNWKKFNQYPELAGRLLETKSAQLGAYIPDDNLIGIGISLDNIQSKNPINWTGQNLLGKALMDIRQKLKSDREAALAATKETTTAAPIKITRRKRPTVAPSTTLPSAALPSVTAALPSAALPSVTSVPSAALPSAALPSAALPSATIKRPPRRKPVVAPPPS